MSTINEGSSCSVLDELAKVAGVTLAEPQLSYTVEYEPDKIVELRREGWAPWERHRWTLILREKDSKQLEPQPENYDQEQVLFVLNEYRGCFPLEKLHLRELLVNFCLLANPDVLLRPNSSASKKSTAPLVAEIKNDLEQLRESLRKQLALKGEYHHAVQCKRCKDAIIKKIEELDARRVETRGKQRYSRWERHRLFDEDCMHAKSACQALDKLCRKFPSIIFELCGLIAPEIPVDSDSEAQDKPLPTRFVLDKTCALTIANNWLRAVRTDQTEYRSYRYGLLSHRRFYSCSVRVSIPRAKEGEGGMPAKLREAVMFSALGYKIDQEAEALMLGELTKEATIPLKCPHALPVSTLIVLPEDRDGVAGADAVAGDHQAHVLNTAAKATKPKKKKAATAAK